MAKRERPEKGEGARQPLLNLPRLMPDGTETRMHPLLWCISNRMHETSCKSDLSRHMGVTPQSLYKWEKKCRNDRHFPLPMLRAVQAAEFFAVRPSLFRPDLEPK